VWLDPEAQVLDGWNSYGPRRLRLALDEWNSIRLPVRLVEATSARASDIVVDIVATLPVLDDSVARDQAGITNVSFELSGNILKARVLIAVATPIGRRFPLVDQQANLLHELGHAIGLPHTRESGAVMATRRTSYQLTGSDIALPRNHYARCPGA
jgi:predicted Zn-dependent protease